MASARFAPCFADASYRLLEVDESVLSEILRDDGSVSIKGAANDEAVLCTSNKTYTMRLAESSNSFLLAPTTRKRPLLETEDSEAVPSIEVQASVSAYFELIRSAPRTGGLLALLSARPHHGAAGPCLAESEDGDRTAAATHGSVTDDLPATEQKRLSLHELEVAVQCSGAELRMALQQARAIDIDGVWCVLDPQLEMDIVECILSLCVEHDWPLTSVPVGECVERSLAHFDGFDERSVRHCLRTHSVHAAAPWSEWLAAATEGCDTVALSPEAVSRFRARALLATCEDWPRDKFLEAWAEALPLGQSPDPAHLRGLAVMLPAFRPAGGASEEEEPRLRGLPLSALSAVAKERFAGLFALKKAWTLDELTPYVEDLLDPGASPTKLVLQHARSVVANDGSVSYVAR